MKQITQQCNRSDSRPALTDISLSRKSKKHNSHLAWDAAAFYN